MISESEAGEEVDEPSFFFDSRLFRWALHFAVFPAVRLLCLSKIAESVSNTLRDNSVPDGDMGATMCLPLLATFLILPLLIRLVGMTYVCGNYSPNIFYKGTHESV